MTDEDYSALGIFPTKGPSYVQRTPTGGLQFTPVGAMNKSYLALRYAPIEPMIEELFGALKRALQAQPKGEQVSIPFHGITVFGREYAYGAQTSAIYIEPHNYLHVVKPVLDASRAEAVARGNEIKAAKRSEAKQNNPYHGISLFPQSVGGGRLRFAIKDALETAMRQQQPCRSDGGYDVTIDGVACAAKLIARGARVHSDSIPALAMLGQRYDEEHAQYLRSQGHHSASQVNLQVWQPLIHGEVTSQHSR